MIYSEVTRTSPVPVWYQIVTAIRGRIEAGDLQPNQSVGTEARLASQFGVGRAAVRQALEELHRDGWLRRDEPRRPMRVRESPVVQDAHEVAGLFSAAFARRGSAVDIVLRDAGEVQDSFVARKLDVPPRAQLFRVVRLFFADGIASALETAWLPAREFPGLLNLDLSQPITKLAREIYGVEYTGGVQQLSARLADDATAGALGLVPPAPLIALTRRSVGSSGQPVEYMESVLRADRYVLSMNFPSLSPNAVDVSTAHESDGDPLR